MRVRLFRLFLLIPCWESQRLIPKRSAGPRATKIGVVSLKALGQRFGWVLGLGGKPEETALFLPVMRQVFAQSQQPARRQRVGLTAREERAHDFRAEIGQPNKRSEPALIHSEASAHCLDAVVRS